MNDKIQYGNVELDEDEFDPKHHCSVRISTMIGLDTLLRLKEKADQEGVDYKLLIDKILREHLGG
jgi:predicted DNA binding CopG/RHH family protein